MILDKHMTHHSEWKNKFFFTKENLPKETLVDLVFFLKINDIEYY